MLHSLRDGLAWETKSFPHHDKAFELSLQKQAKTKSLLNPRRLMTSKRFLSFYTKQTNKRSWIVGTIMEYSFQFSALNIITLWCLDIELLRYWV